jgi:predicted MFS family arabinose efflux permease
VPELGWSHWQSWLSISLGSLLFGFFIFLEKRRKEPMVRLALFSNRNFAGANLLTFLLYAGLGAGMLFLTLNLIQIQGYSQLQAGLTLLPFTLMMAIIAPWAGGMVAKTGPRLFLSAGPAFAGLGFWLLSHVGLTAGPSAFWTSFLPGIGVFGLGMSLTVAPLTTTVMSSVADDYSGTASGVNNSMNRLANVFANAIIGAFAIQIFEPELMAEVQELNLPEVALQAIEREAVELGNAEVPGEVGARYQPKVESAIDQAFVATFQIILRLCAVVAWLSGLCAFLMIRNVELNKSDKD